VKKKYKKVSMKIINQGVMIRQTYYIKVLFVICENKKSKKSKKLEKVTIKKQTRVLCSGKH